jgi:hypothetical protein
VENLFQSQALESEAGLTAASVGMLVLAVLLTFFLPRRYASLPLLACACFMPLGQKLVVAGLNFFFFRILLFVGFLRVVQRQEIRGFVPNSMDRLFVAWLGVTVVVGTFTKLSWAFFVHRCSDAYNAGLTYLLVRCLVRDPEDLILSLRFLAVMLVPLAASTIIEKITQRNLFAFLGGVPWLTVIRDEKFRCQGPFQHPILAGTFAATCLPLILVLWWQGKQHRKHALVGTASAVWVAYAAASSGALMAVATGALGTLMWRMRRRMRLFRRGTVAMILALACVMNAPVWYLIARVSDVTGGTGWHRSYLIDQAINHFDEWWLVGSAYTAHWAPGGQVLVVDPDNMDITNNYIAEGLHGGILKLGLFIAMIVLSFKILGRGALSDSFLSPPLRRLYWLVGVCLASHCVSFISVSYFDQTAVYYYWLLAVVAMLAEWRLSQQPEPGLETAGLAEDAGAGGAAPANDRSPLYGIS